MDLGDKTINVFNLDQRHKCALTELARDFQVKVVDRAPRTDQETPSEIQGVEQIEAADK